MEEELKTFLLKTARDVIFYGLKEGKKIPPLTHPKNETLNQKRGTFVTLKKNGKLRGCIGNIEPVYTIFEGVVRNANNAAFFDPRFNPISLEEFPETKIEISILTEPKEVSFKDYEDLKKKVRKGIDGVILSFGENSATYLPQVWEEVEGKDEFFFSLCLKAGLSPSVLFQDGLKVKTYQVEHFSE